MSLTLKYGILLQEGQVDRAKFQVVTDIWETVTTLESVNTISDVVGSAKPNKLAWGNGWQVEWFEETQSTECVQAITDAMNIFNAKYPDNPITIDQLLK